MPRTISEIIEEGIKMDLPNEIMELFKKHVKENVDYINPEFLGVIQSNLDIYYNLQDNTLDGYIGDMWSRNEKEIKMDLPNEIMELFKKHVKENKDYINPHFLSAIVEALSDYYNLEDYYVDTFIQKMWSR